MKKNFVKLASVAMSAAIAAGCCSSVLAADLTGDANADGVIDASDALAALEYTVGRSPEGFNLAAADVNADGVINSLDALGILEICVGLVENPIDPDEPVDPDVKDPTNYDKAEIVAYYNNALKSAYSSDTVTIAKKTDVEVVIDEIPAALKSIAQSLINENAKPTDETVTFTNGAAADGTTAEKFLVPTALEADGAKEAKIEKTENGYKVTITLVSENCTHKTEPKYNTQASTPLIIPLGTVEEMGAKIKSSKFTYSGTVITAEMDSQGNIISLNHTMPLAIEASGSYGLFKLDLKGHGTYSMDATFTK